MTLHRPASTNDIHRNNHINDISINDKSTIHNNDKTKENTKITKLTTIVISTLTTNRREDNQGTNTITTATRSDINNSTMMIITLIATMRQ